jgi:hypothetical protein
MALLKERVPRFVELNLVKAKGCLYFGIPIEDMDKEELMACLVDCALRSDRLARQARKTLGLASMTIAEWG